MKLDKPDVVVALTDPPVIGLAAWLVGKRHSIPFVMSYRDIFPEVARLLEDFQSDTVEQVLQYVNRFLVRNAHRSVALGESMRKKLIEEKYQYHEAIVFHARGTGGRAMEELIREGVIKGVIDITTTEWADELVGGIRSAGPHRLEAAGEVGIPQLIGPGALDMVNFGPRDTVPMKFNGRKFYTHTPLVTLMRTTVAENRRLGEIIAEKLNQAKGKTLVIIPLRGFSTIDEKDSPFFDPDADRAFVEGLGEHIRKDIEVLKLDYHINDDRFAEETAKQFIQMMT